jgi:hypothetical protein
LDKCGHAPMLEVPGEFNQILESFLKELDQRNGDGLGKSE